MCVSMKINLPGSLLKKYLFEINILDRLHDSYFTLSSPDFLIAFLIPQLKIFYDLPLNSANFLCSSLVASVDWLIRTASSDAMGFSFYFICFVFVILVIGYWLIYLLLKMTGTLNKDIVNRSYLNTGTTQEKTVLQHDSSNNV